MNACVYIYMYMYMYICMYVYVYIHIYIYMYICMYTYTYTYVCMYIYPCIITNMFIICIYVRTHAHTDLLPMRAQLYQHASLRAEGAVFDAGRRIRATR